MEVVQEMTDDDQEWGEVAQQVVVGQVEAEQHFVVESEQFQRPEQIVEALEETDQFQNQEQVTENVETDQFLSQEQVAENIETDKFLNEEQVVKEVEEVPHVGKDVMDQLRNKFSKPQRTEIHSTGPTLPKGLFARLREKYLSNSTKPGEQQSSAFIRRNRIHKTIQLSRFHQNRRRESHHCTRRRR